MTQYHGVSQNNDLGSQYDLVSQYDLLFYCNISNNTI